MNVVILLLCGIASCCAKPISRDCFGSGCFLHSFDAPQLHRLAPQPFYARSDYLPSRVIKPEELFEDALNEVLNEDKQVPAIEVTGGSSDEIEQILEEIEKDGIKERTSGETLREKTKAVLSSTEEQELHRIISGPTAETFVSLPSSPHLQETVIDERPPADNTQFVDETIHAAPGNLQEEPLKIEPQSVPHHSSVIDESDNVAVDDNKHVVKDHDSATNGQPDPSPDVHDSPIKKGNEAVPITATSLAEIIGAIAGNDAADRILTILRNGIVVEEADQLGYSQKSDHEQNVEPETHAEPLSHPVPVKTIPKPKPKPSSTVGAYGAGNIAKTVSKMEKKAVSEAKIPEKPIKEAEKAVKAPKLTPAKDLLNIDREEFFKTRGPRFRLEDSEGIRAVAVLEVLHGIADHLEELDDKYKSKSAKSLKREARKAIEDIKFGYVFDAGQLPIDDLNQLDEILQVLKLKESDVTQQTEQALEDQERLLKVAAKAAKTLRDTVKDIKKETEIVDRENRKARKRIAEEARKRIAEEARKRIAEEARKRKEIEEQKLQENRKENEASRDQRSDSSENDELRREVQNDRKGSESSKERSSDTSERYKQSREVRNDRKGSESSESSESSKERSSDTSERYKQSREVQNDRKGSESSKERSSDTSERYKQSREVRNDRKGSESSESSKERSSDTSERYKQSREVQNDRKRSESSESSKERSSDSSESDERIQKEKPREKGISGGKRGWGLDRKGVRINWNEAGRQSLFGKNREEIVKKFRSLGGSDRIMRLLGDGNPQALALLRKRLQSTINHLGGSSKIQQDQLKSLSGSQSQRISKLLGGVSSIAILKGKLDKAANHLETTPNIKSIKIQKESEKLIDKAQNKNGEEDNKEASVEDGEGGIESLIQRQTENTGKEIKEEKIVKEESQEKLPKENIVPAEETKPVKTDRQTILRESLRSKLSENDLTVLRNLRKKFSKFLG